MRDILEAARDVMHKLERFDIDRCSVSDTRRRSDIVVASKIILKIVRLLLGKLDTVKDQVILV